MNLVQRYKAASNIGTAMTLYLRLWHIDISVAVENMQLSYCTTARFSGFGIIDEFIPINERQNISKTLIRCPLELDINLLGFDKDEYSKGRLGIFILYGAEAKLKINLPESVLTRIFELSRDFPEASHKKRELSRVSLTASSDTNPPLEPDFFLRINFEPNDVAPNDDEKMFFNITYLTTCSG